MLGPSYIWMNSIVLIYLTILRKSSCLPRSQKRSREIEALAVLEKYPNAMFLTDDAAARLVSERMGFKVHGTIGLLVRSIRRRQRKPLDVLKILSDIPNKSTLYLKTSLLEDAKMRIRKEFGL